MDSPVARQLLEIVRRGHAEMIDLLEALVKAESPSHERQSQAAVQALLCDALGSAGYAVQKTPGNRTGGHLFASPPGWSGNEPSQLLLGHCDTVWPLGTIEEMPVQIRDGKFYGPGAYDMKAGLVQAVYALQALHSLGLPLAVTPVVLINSDEEIGSPESTDAICDLARRVDRVLVMEPSLGSAGALKTARKGVGRFTITVTGRAAHAGLEPEKGVSAILELTYVIQQLFALNDPERGITINVGTIDGGLRPNVVAPKSRAEVDVRVATRADAERIEAAIRALQPVTPGTRLEITGDIGRPPMERTPGNQRLWQLAAHAAEQLGIELGEGNAGGGSDGNSTSQFVPTLDGLGAVGDGAHSSTEHVQLEKMIERCALLAAILLAPRQTSENSV